MAAKTRWSRCPSGRPTPLRSSRATRWPRSRSAGKFLIGLGIVAAVGAVVVVLANRKPKDDPWATPSTSYTPPAKTFGDRVSVAKETVTAAAGTAAHKASELADKAKDVAGEAADKAKDAAR